MEESINEEAAGAAAEMIASVVIPFIQFIPLIDSVADILKKVIELYGTAQHNKRITKLLMERVAAANSAISILQEDELFSSTHYLNLQRLVQVLRKMEKFSEEITQYNKVQKFLGAQTIETTYEALCKDYESTINVLQLTLMANFKVNADRERKILKEDIDELMRFQGALVESITDVGKKVDDAGNRADENFRNMDKKVSEIVDKVSKLALTMENLDDKGANQEKIDNIFRETPLPFDDYEETDIVRGDDVDKKLRKYRNVKTQEEYAFKTIESKQINKVKNQVTILKKLKDCQYIIQFFGITEDSGGIYYLVTEWAEKKNLREYISENPNSEVRERLSFAYDIAKGLCFLSAVKIVHRDIKATNIVITEHNVAKITNFKLSRRFDTATENVVVDNRHSSPEILRRGMAGEAVDKKKKYDAKCEVYSFGILLWEIAERRTPYSDCDDFMEIAQKVIDGYREPFSDDNGFPEEYKELVIKATDQNPGQRPIFSKMLLVLQDAHRNYKESRVRPAPAKKSVPVRQNSVMTDLSSFNYLTVDKAVEEHKKNFMDKKILYKCFDTYANLGNPKAKYWKAYFITKNWSDLKLPPGETNKMVVELYKEAADQDCEESSDAQLRYAQMVMQGKGVKRDMEVTVEYLLKAANGGHIVAMFNVATFYFANNHDELGKYYMIKAANKGYDDAIKYCKTNGISYLFDDKK